MSEANLPPQEDELPANAEAFSARGKKRRRKLKMAGEDIGGLNLTAMMDMMTILLVFLVKSYTTDAEKFTISEKLRPPMSTAVAEVKPAVTVTVTTEAIFVDDVQALLISDLQNMSDKALIPDLEEALNRRIDKLKEMEKLTGVPFDGSLLLVAHQTTPYNLLTAVLYTAGQAHFSDYRLMVMKKQKS